MSEMKAGVIITPHDEVMIFDRGSDTIAVTERETEFYLKSEADKVIAELEERIDDGDKNFEMSNSQNERLLKIVRHHKYKRCLAIAMWCASIATKQKKSTCRLGVTIFTAKSLLPLENWVLAK